MQKIIGLTPSQYQILSILRKNDKFMNEKEIREKYGRKSSLSPELKRLSALGLIERKRNSRAFSYKIKNEEGSL